MKPCGKAGPAESSNILNSDIAVRYLWSPRTFRGRLQKDRAGVRHRQLGVFGDPGTKLEMISLAPGVTLPLEDRSIYFVSHGAGQVPSRGRVTQPFFLSRESAAQ